jgi:hypothetical protein
MPTKGFRLLMISGSDYPLPTRGFRVLIRSGSEYPLAERGFKVLSNARGLFILFKSEEMKDGRIKIYNSISSGN